MQQCKESFNIIGGASTWMFLEAMSAIFSSAKFNALNVGGYCNNSLPRKSTNSFDWPKNYHKATNY